MKQEIEREIRKAINRHLVVHVQVPKEDGRDRIDILVDEAATEILKLVAKPVLAVRACEGSCDVHRGEVVPVIIEGHGWDGTKFNYCQAAIEEDERRGFVVRHDR